MWLKIKQPDLVSVSVALILLVILFSLLFCSSTSYSQDLPPDYVAVGVNWVPFLLNTGEFRIAPVAILEKVDSPSIPITPKFAKDLQEEVCKEINTIQLRNRCIQIINDLGLTGIGKAWSHIRKVSPPSEDDSGCREPSLKEWDIFHRRIAKSFGSGGRLMEWILVQIPLEVRAEITQNIRNLRRGC